MTLRALAFTITEILDGRLWAHAVLCPLARYASMRRPGASRLNRLHVPDWRPLEGATARTFSAAPLESDDPIATLFAGSARTWHVAFLASMDLDVVSPFAVADDLDRFLRGLAA